MLIVQRLKTAYWMEQVHHKLREIHRLEALRSPTSVASLNATVDGTDSVDSSGSDVGEGAVRALRLRVGAADSEYPTDPLLRHHNIHRATSQEETRHSSRRYLRSNKNKYG